MVEKWCVGYLTDVILTRDPWMLHRSDLAGVAGGTWSSGRGWERIELDAVEFCRILAGRREWPGLLSVRVPF